MIQFKYSKMLTKTQEFGEANFYKERNMNTKVREDIWLTLISKLAQLLVLASTISNFLKPMISLSTTWEKDLINSPKSALKVLWVKSKVWPKTIKVTMISWSGCSKVQFWLCRYRSLKQRLPGLRLIQSQCLQTHKVEQPKIVRNIQVLGGER